MKSMNKHVPMLVFFVGLFFVLISIRSFFHPAAPKVNLPVVAPIVQDLPTAKPPPKELKASKGVYIPKATEPSPLTPDQLMGDRGAQSRILVNRHLHEVGLDFKLPENWAYGTTNDGPVKVLVGSTRGQPEFYMFSVPGEYSADRAKDYMMSYFRDEAPLNPPGGAIPVDNRSEMRDMSVFKGNSPEGYDYHAYYFKDSKNMQTHMMVLMGTGPNLQQNQPKIQQTLDSIRSLRP